MAAMSSVPGPATAGEVFSLIRDGRARTRSDVGRLTGLSRTAVAARLATLLESGLVVEADDERAPSTGGRPAVHLRFNRDAGVVLAGAIGRSRTQLGVCDRDGRVLAELDVDQEVGPGPDELMPVVVDGFRSLLADVARVADDVRAIGLSIPGTVDAARGASLDSPIMAGWDGVELAPFVRELTPAPVFVDNDANVMALSERRGHLERHRDLLFVKASTGVGVGIVSGGQVLRGAQGRPARSGTPRSPRPRACPAAAATPVASRRSPPAGRWSSRPRSVVSTSSTSATWSGSPSPATPTPGTWSVRPAAGSVRRSPRR